MGIERKRRLLLPALVLGTLAGLWPTGCGQDEVVDHQLVTAQRNPPQAQGGDPRSVETTQHIRSRLMAHDHLSFQAKHITVVTNDGYVVLDGLVASDEEKDQVMRIARSAAQDWEVDDRLSIADQAEPMAH